MAIDDPILSACYLEKQITDWVDYLGTEDQIFDERKIERHSRTGRPLGSETFKLRLGKILNRNLVNEKPGPKAKVKMSK